MKIKSVIIGAVMILVTGLCIFALVKFHKADAGGDDDDAGPTENVTPVISVQTGTLKRMTLHQYVSGYGTVVPSPPTTTNPAAGGPISAPGGSTVANVLAVAGQHVNAGDVLVTLDTPTITHAFAKASVERQKQLFSQQNTSLKNLQDAQAQLAVLEIRAPISGTVTRMSARPGAAVDPSVPLAEVIDLDHLTINAQIPSSDAAHLKTGQDVILSTDPPVTASLSFISPAIDPNDGTVLTRVELPPNSALRPGQFVPLKIVTDVHTNCLAAPDESVVTTPDNKTVVVLVKGDEAAQVPITKGLQEDDWIEVDGAALKEGDSVVTLGAYGFPEKAKIKTQNTGPNEVTATNAAE